MKAELRLEPHEAHEIKEALLKAASVTPLVPPLSAESVARDLVAALRFLTDATSPAAASERG